MQTQISTNYISSSSLLTAGLLFESNPPDPIDPPDNTKPGSKPAQPQEEKPAES